MRPGPGGAPDRAVHGLPVAGRGWPALAVLVLLAVLGPAAALPAVAESVRAALPDGMVASLDEDHQLYLEAPPAASEGLLAFARRLCVDQTAAAGIAAANDGARSLLSGVRYRVPFDLLRPELQLQVIQALFAEDEAESDGWRHKARGEGPLGRESLWSLAAWFTGKGENFRAIREYNRLEETDVDAGQTVTIPAEILRPALRGALPAASGPEVGSPLSFAKDSQGDYAVYRLRPGEALYSSVVVRFTGRVLAADVNALAADVARRSGISDVTDIPIGYEVKIPLDLLMPEFLPPGDPRRREYEASLAESAHFRNQIRAQDLKGITVVLDAGHGGRDTGATMDGVWESLYVYDVMLRVKRLLENFTAATVFATTRDGDQFRIEDRDVLSFSRGHEVLTSPRYPIDDPTVALHLRWYLANSLYRHAVKSSGDPEKVVFLSIHGDSLHPSLRGAMAYIPAARLVDASYGKSGAVYAARREVTESPRVHFSWQERVRSEGLSRELAGEIIRALDREEIGVNPFKPVREQIIRRRGNAWVPAVLRYNEIPAKVLLEICNLANPEDRHLLQTRAWRQHLAEAIIKGLLAYYGKDGADEARGEQVAKATK